MVPLVAFGNVATTWRTERQQNVMPILKAGVLYFALVFGAGFVLGTIRTLWIVPRLGTRMSELMETPIMLVITILAARWTVRRLAHCGLYRCPVIAPPHDLVGDWRNVASVSNSESESLRLRRPRAIS
jgi:hypothetical protein